MEEERRKVYVEVDVTHRTDGTARPQRIKFENGEVYEIDRVKCCCRAASTKVGGTGPLKLAPQASNVQYVRERGCFEVITTLKVSSLSLRRNGRPRMSR